MYTLIEKYKAWKTKWYPVIIISIAAYVALC